MRIDVLEIMRGKGGVGAGIVRAAMACVEPIYASAVSLRNVRYNMTGGARIPRPVISIGNITTGGTGKTPVVRWLADAMRQRGVRPVVLMRGYRSSEGNQSDEQLMLDGLLNTGAAERVPVIANPNRVGAARDVLQNESAVDVFLLDDGFQHRQLARDFDLVLIDATNPFGFDHVLPRGLLREPLGGLRRASAFLITRADQRTREQLEAIGQTLSRYNAAAPVYRADHCIGGIPVGKIFAFAGIGNPGSLEAQLSSGAAAFRPDRVIAFTKEGGETPPLQTSLVGCRWLVDHHAYTSEEIDDLRREATRLGADQLVTTEKDWVKIARLSNAESDGLPIVRLNLQIRFHDQDEQRLLEQILKALPARDGSSAR